MAPQRRERLEESRKGPQPGHLVATKVTQYPEEPQIGRVMSIHNDMVTLQWFVGSYDRAWCEAYHTDAEVSFLWIEEIDVKDIIMNDIVLTKGSKLPRRTVEQLKTKYSSLN